MRNDSIKHYQEVRFNMNKNRFMDILYNSIKEVKKYSDDILLYGQAVKRFGRWL